MSSATETIAIFVDVQNVYYTTRQAYGRNFDYNGFWARVTANRSVTNAIAYAIDQPADVDVSELVVRPTASPY